MPFHRMFVVLVKSVVVVWCKVTFILGSYHGELSLVILVTTNILILITTLHDCVVSQGDTISQNIDMYLFLF